MHPKLVTINTLADELQVTIARMNDPRHALVPVAEGNKKLLSCKQFVYNESLTGVTNNTTSHTNHNKRRLNFEKYTHKSNVTATMGRCRIHRIYVSQMFIETITLTEQIWQFFW